MVFQLTALWLCLHSELCVPFNAAADNGTVHCRYKTPLLAISISHTVFFLNNETKSLCSFAPRKFDRLALSCEFKRQWAQQSVFQDQPLYRCGSCGIVRALPPLNLSSSEEDDGGRRLQWSSPYPLSSLNQNLTYQVSYRTQTEDSWTVSPKHAFSDSEHLDTFLILVFVKMVKDVFKDVWKMCS